MRSASAAIAALAGIVLGFKDENIQFNQFTMFGSINSVEYAVVGGLGWAGGAVIGATLATGAALSKLATDAVSDQRILLWVSIAAGAVVVTVLRLAPEGLFGTVAGLLHRPSKPSKTRPATPRQERSHRRLELCDVTVRFGGVVALSEISFTVEPGEVLGLIGPNGAGKTTLLDVATGFTPLSGGTVRLEGRGIDRWSPERRARHGLSRSFQAVELFDELTVRENLLVAADRKSPLRYLSDLVYPTSQTPSAAMLETVSHFELDALLDHRPAELSQGQARLVGIARAMCAEPSLLFLDEPAAGLDAHDRVELGRKIRSLATDRGIEIV